MRPYIPPSLKHTLLSPKPLTRPLIPIRISRLTRQSQSRTMSSSSTAPTPSFSSNYDPEQGARDLAPLLAGEGGKWALIESGKGVERNFKFKTFKKTWVSYLPKECDAGGGGVDTEMYMPEEGGMKNKADT